MFMYFRAVSLHKCTCTGQLRGGVELTELPGDEFPRGAMSSVLFSEPLHFDIFGMCVASQQMTNILADVAGNIELYVAGMVGRTQRKGTAAQRDNLQCVPEALLLQ